MVSRENKGSAGVIVIVIIVLVIVGIVMANRWLQKETGEIVSKSSDTPAEKPTSSPLQKKRSKTIQGEDFIREVRLSPDRKIEISIIHQGSIEIARFKESKGEIYDLIGQIPDGKVKFINKSNETYGVEYFRNGKRHGPAVVYYSDDVLRQELFYQYGKLMTNTEYYHDGAVRMEQDYSDARGYGDDPEVGIGKVYTRHGTVKFEWFLINSEPVGFKKSYNQKGGLVDTVYFDEYGQVIEPEQALPSVADAPSANILMNSEILAAPETSPIVEKPPKQIFVPANSPSD